MTAACPKAMVHGPCGEELQPAGALALAAGALGGGEGA